MTAPCAHAADGQGEHPSAAPRDADATSDSQTAPTGIFALPTDGRAIGPQGKTRDVRAGPAGRISRRLDRMEAGLQGAGTAAHFGSSLRRVSRRAHPGQQSRVQADRGDRQPRPAPLLAPAWATVPPRPDQQHPPAAPSGPRTLPPSLHAAFGPRVAAPNRPPLPCGRKSRPNFGQANEDLQADGWPTDPATCSASLSLPGSA